MMIGWILLAAALIFAAVLIVRAASCKPVEPDYGPDVEVKVQADAADHLAQLVRIPTVSNYDDCLLYTSRCV